MPTKKKEADDIVNKVLEKLAHVLRDYNDVVDTVTQQKAFQTLDYDDLTDKMTRSIKGVHSVESAIHKMSDKKIEIPRFTVHTNSPVEVRISTSNGVIRL